jgi:AcrR family transcriptional regulator
MPRRVGDTSAAIVEVATQLFSDRGFTGTGVAEISKALGVTNAALYYHFSSKQALLYATLEGALSEHLERLEAIAAADGSPEQKLRRALENHLDFIFHRPAAIRVFLRERRFLDPKPAAAYQKQVKRYDGIFEQLISAHLSSRPGEGPDPHLMRLAVLGMLNWITQWYRTGGRLTERQIRDGMMTAIMEQLLSVARPGRAREVAAR